MIRFQKREDVSRRRDMLYRIISGSPIDDNIANINIEHTDALKYDIFKINIKLNNYTIPFIQTLSLENKAYHILYNLVDYIYRNLKYDTYYVILHITIDDHIMVDMSDFFNNFLYYLRPREIDITHLNYYYGTINLENIFGDPTNTMKFGLKDCLLQKIITIINIDANNDAVTRLYKDFFERFDVGQKINVHEHSRYSHIDYPLYDDSEIDFYL